MPSSPSRRLRLAASPLAPRPARYAAALGVAALLLAGCATPPPPAPPPPAPVMCVAPPHTDDTAAPPAAGTEPGGTRAGALRQAETNTALLAFADRVRSMTPNELSAEIARLSDTPDPLRGPYGDLQLAVALGQTRAAQDTVRAQALLQRLATGSSEDVRRLQPMARLLAFRYAEQRRVEDQLDRQNQQLRDSQRRIDQLNERLEAVRAIERSLTRSGSSGAGGNPSPAPAPAPAAAAKP
ncbi:MAG: hypothetical protein V4505_23480 [Pseudomonadota bacterium]